MKISLTFQGEYFHLEPVFKKILMSLVLWCAQSCEKKLLGTFFFRRRRSFFFSSGTQKSSFLPFLTVFSHFSLHFWAFQPKYHLVQTFLMKKSKKISKNFKKIKFSTFLVKIFEIFRNFSNHPKIGRNDLNNKYNR